MALNTIYGTTLAFAAVTPKPNCLSALSSRSDRYPLGWISKIDSYLPCPCQQACSSLIFLSQLMEAPSIAQVNALRFFSASYFSLTP